MGLLTIRVAQSKMYLSLRTGKIRVTEQDFFVEHEINLAKGNIQSRLVGFNWL